MDARKLPGMLREAGIATEDEAERLLVLIAEEERAEGEMFFKDSPRNRGDELNRVGA